MSRNENPAFFSASVVDISRQTLSLLRETPTVLLLFVFLGFLDFCALLLLFFSHSKPVSIMFAPIIRAYWGGRFLHYPDNFLQKFMRLHQI